VFRRGAHVALLAAAAAGLVWLGTPMCPFAAFVHQPCPGCGLTRAALAAFALDFDRAFALHPLVFFALPLLAAGALLGAKAYVLEGRFRLSRGFARFFGPAFVLLMLAMIALWVARFQGAFGGPVSV